MMKEPEKLKTDVPVIGGGGVGCRAAIEAASCGCHVLLASKFPVARSGATVVGRRASGSDCRIGASVMTARTSGPRRCAAARRVTRP